ncbi:MAG: tRNA (adenosine(37)-N6)-threonylcarbamoyltransferase complex dimerization subunit type 1 TsaB [Ruminococcus flavefaciens]|nr:tRNA (adenosine(37)-N6)-threonylcarbamoyltransferase complex dimerization subunit type 1 TsaB [Ruminococcus flavefaciens]
MLILGIDTSGKTASSALFDTETETFLAESTLYTQKTHSQVIMPMIKSMIADAGKTLSDIDRIAVANGPGSYTGLRIGVAGVKAMCFALGCKCTGVSTLEGLAYNNVAFHGRICAVMKARGELVYTCSYMSDGFSLKPLCEESIISRDELAEFLAGTETLLCGEGAGDFFNDYKSEDLFVAPPHSRLQNACGVCLASLSREEVTPEELEVSYLQKVKAEKDLEEKNR